MQNDFFENYADHIRLLFKRSSKEHSQIFVRLQKGNIYSLLTFNGIIEREFIKLFEGINLHKFSKHGFTLFASSDRMHLQDVATRLYQELDNIIKSYKGHKVHTTPIKIETELDSKCSITEVDICELDTGYIRDITTQIYESLNDYIKQKYFVYINVNALSSIWQISYENTNQQFSECTSYLICKLEDRHTGNLLEKVIPLQQNEIKNKNVNVEAIIKEINQFGNPTPIASLTNRYGVANHVSPSLIVLDEHITASILIKLYQQASHNIIPSISEYTESLLDAEYYPERHDKFGRYNFASSSSNITLRQTLFYQKPSFVHRCLMFKDSVDIDLLDKDLENLIMTLSKHFQSQHILLLYREHYDAQYIKESTHENIVLNPLHGIYSPNGRDMILIDFNYIEIPQASQLKLIKGNKYKLVELPVYQTYVGIYGFSYGLITNTENITLI